ncbi:MAG: hypothetical protein ACE5IJ_12170 [Thermoplasmata archaeon]
MNRICGRSPCGSSRQLEQGDDEGTPHPQAQQDGETHNDDLEHPGREGYIAFHARTFSGVHGALLVADLTRKETLSSLELYRIPSLFRVVENVPLVPACSKSDLTDEID